MTKVPDYSGIVETCKLFQKTLEAHDARVPPQCKGCTKISEAHAELPPSPFPEDIVMKCDRCLKRQRRANGA